jgi:hypothetical protein
VAAHQGRLTEDSLHNPVEDLAPNNKVVTTLIRSWFPLPMPLLDNRKNSTQIPGLIPAYMAENVAFWVLLKSVAFAILEDTNAR